MALSGADAGARSRTSGGSARIGNVAAVLAPSLSASADRVDAARSVLTDCFVSVHETEPRLPALARALEAGDEERMLVATVGERGISLDAVLAMTCWPEVEALVYDDTGSGALVLIRRETALSHVREALQRGEDDPTAWLASVETERVGPAALGLATPAAEAR